MAYECVHVSIHACGCACGYEHIGVPQCMSRGHLVLSFPFV